MPSFKFHRKIKKPFAKPDAGAPAPTVGISSGLPSPDPSLLGRALHERASRSGGFEGAPRTPERLAPNRRSKSHEARGTLLVRRRTAQKMGR
jgi:hypothetical protein